MFPADEKSLSDGTEVEGIAKYIRACLASLRRIAFFSFYQIKGLEVLGSKGNDI